jgi:hypothetical protein
VLRIEASCGEGSVGVPWWCDVAWMLWNVSKITSIMFLETISIFATWVIHRFSWVISFFYTPLFSNLAMFILNVLTNFWHYVVAGC